MKKQIKIVKGTKMKEQAPLCNPIYAPNVK